MEEENAVQTVQGQTRTLKGSTEGRCPQRIPKEHGSVPWMVSHAAEMLTRYLLHGDDKTSYEMVQESRLSR